MKDVIAIAGLVKRYGVVTALDGVDLAVPAGSVHGLLGANGAGKTTAVNVLTTQVLPDEGRATVCGHDVVTEASAVRGLIAVSGQHPTVDAMLTGRENLTLIATLSQLPWRRVRRRVSELLAEVGLADAADRVVDGYSGGMRRRLDLAGALVAEPAVLLLDEPTTGLDPHSRADLYDRIRALAAGGTTVLLTTQYLEEADELADHVAVLDHGRVIAQGSPAELKARLGTSTIELHMADAKTADDARQVLAPLEPLPPASDRDRATVRLRANDGTHRVVEILRELDAARLAPQGMEVRDPSLDDVFLTLTGDTPTDAQTAPSAAGAAQ